MTKKNHLSEFDCTKCRNHFLGQDSLHGELRVETDGIKRLSLCYKCHTEVLALLGGECQYIERHIKERIEHYANRHGKDNHADAKRIAYEEILDLLANHCTMFDGENLKSYWGKDMTQLERTARRTIHDFNINCEEQVRIPIISHRSIVDGLIHTKGKSIVLEYDGQYHHTLEKQKEKDEYKDFMLTEYGGYKVLRIPYDIIYDTSRFRTILLDALYGVRSGAKKANALRLPVKKEAPCGLFLT